MSLTLGGVAKATRSAREIERRKNLEFLADRLAKEFRISQNSIELEFKLNWHVNRFTQGVNGNRPILEDLSQYELVQALLKAVKKAYKLPNIMTPASAERFRHFGILYHNPTAYEINVSPMGLPDELGNQIQTVKPGSLVLVPAPLVEGGKRSVVTSCAPQLKRLPDKAHDHMLDMLPVSYDEWITFRPLEQSKCCRKLLIWSDAAQSPVCMKCKTRAILEK
jgi:hypothetical protein